MTAKCCRVVVVGAAGRDFHNLDRYNVTTSGLIS